MNKPPSPLAPNASPPAATQKVRVIDSLWTFWIAVLCVGPFALPLLWRNPRFKRSTKVLGSLVIIGITVFCVWALKVATQMAAHLGVELDQLSK